MHLSRFEAVSVSRLPLQVQCPRFLSFVNGRLGLQNCSTSYAENVWPPNANASWKEVRGKPNYPTKAQVLLYKVMRGDGFAHFGSSHVSFLLLMKHATSPGTGNLLVYTSTVRTVFSERCGSVAMASCMLLGGNGRNVTKFDWDKGPFLFSKALFCVFSSHGGVLVYPIWFSFSNSSPHDEILTWELSESYMTGSCD